MSRVQTQSRPTAIAAPVCPLSAPIILVKLRVEIAVLGNSPCEIAVLSSKNGDFTRGIADFGYFTP
ncbi:hypothetical protein GBA69_05425 [Bifidobacterium bifidum]|nr:hypothetical protein GBA73_04450 [Bifidobacterium bifidum]KAB5612238.1 hypothetical protein GBA72_07280 [Bifidobacterium bifidum]KAB5615589.1 hypothetical protein GBA70_06720 [Bifidobacterium bifidum]KAB5618440.1 hypothetical protein GBA71_08435 [Bifidobacterium bifidum]KAB5621539.1 hypothetical protein GBA68_07270 [Bifidobacterium bifidum]